MLSDLQKEGWQVHDKPSPFIFYQYMGVEVSFTFEDLIRELSKIFQ